MLCREAILQKLERCKTLERSGQIQAAFQVAEDALQCSRKLGQKDLVARALVESAKVYYRMGFYDEARLFSKECLRSSTDDFQLRANAWQVLANCAADTETFEKAGEAYHQAASMARLAADEISLIAALHGLASGVYTPCGLFSLAQETEEEVLAIAQRGGYLDVIPYPLTSRAILYQVTGKLVEAHQTLELLSQMVEKDSLLDGYRLCLEGALALDVNTPNFAYPFLSQAKYIADVTGEPWLNTSFRIQLSRYFRMKGSYSAAMDWADDALNFATRSGAGLESGKSLVERARVFWLLGDLEQAKNDLEKAYQIFIKKGARYDLAYCLLLQSGCSQVMGSPQALLDFSRAIDAILQGDYDFLFERERPLVMSLLSEVDKQPGKKHSQLYSRLIERLKNVPPPALKIFMLGSFKVWQSGMRLEEQRLRQRQADRLLAALLLAKDNRLSSDELIEMLWPSKTPSSGLVALNHASSTLRKVLEPDLPDRYPSRYLRIEEGWVSFILPIHSWVDVQQFENFYQHQDFRKAVDLYKGELLPGYLYESWTDIPRQRLHLLFQKALHELAQNEFRQGHYYECLQVCQRLLILEPWHEQAALLGMQAAIEINDYLSARRIYTELKSGLLNDLGTLPQAELQVFYNSITPKFNQE